MEVTGDLPVFTRLVLGLPFSTAFFLHTPYYIGGCIDRLPGEQFSGLRLSGTQYKSLILNTNKYQKEIQRDHYLRSPFPNFPEGFKEAAEKFKVESGIQPSVDLETLDERIKIRDAVQTGRIEEAISLVNNLHPELLDNNRYLYFHLQVI